MSTIILVVPQQANRVFLKKHEEIKASHQCAVDWERKSS